MVKYLEEEKLNGNGKLDIGDPQDEDKCCYCFSMYWGIEYTAYAVMFLALYLQMQFFGIIFRPYGDDPYILIFSTLGGIIALPVMWTGCSFGSWWRSDCWHTRKRLPLAMYIFLVC